MRCGGHEMCGQGHEMCGSCDIVRCAVPRRWGVGAVPNPVRRLSGRGVSAAWVPCPSQCGGRVGAAWVRAAAEACGSASLLLSPAAPTEACYIVQSCSCRPCMAEEASWMHFCFAAAARAIAKLDLRGCHLWGIAPPVAERRVRRNRLRGWHDLVQSCEV